MDLHGVGGLAGTIRDQSKASVASGLGSIRPRQLPPDTIGKTQVLAQRALNRKNHLLASLW